MPRAGDGTYSLPSGNPVQSGTIISSAWANNTLEDIAAELNSVMTRDGKLGPSSPFKIVPGTRAAPGLSFSNEAGLGIYRRASGKLAFTQNDTDRLVVGSDGVGVPGKITFKGDVIFDNGNSMFRMVRRSDTHDIRFNNASTGNIGLYDETAGEFLFYLRGSDNVFQTVDGIDVRGQGTFSSYVYVDNQNDRRFAWRDHRSGDLFAIQHSNANIGIYNSTLSEWQFRFQYTTGRFLIGPNGKSAALEEDLWTSPGDIPHFSGGAGAGTVSMNANPSTNTSGSSWRVLGSGGAGLYQDGTVAFKVNPDGQVDVYGYLRPNNNQSRKVIWFDQGAEEGLIASSVNLGLYNYSKSGWWLRTRRSDGQVYSGDEDGTQYRITRSGDSVVWDGGEYSMDTTTGRGPGRGRTDYKVPSGYVLTGVQILADQISNGDDKVSKLYAHKLRTS